jgi:hypothetical protein
MLVTPLSITGGSTSRSSMGSSKSTRPRGERTSISQGSEGSLSTPNVTCFPGATNPAAISFTIIATAFAVACGGTSEAPADYSVHVENSTTL